MRPVTNAESSADPHVADMMAARDGTNNASGVDCSDSVTAERATAPMESSEGVLTSTVYAPRERPPTTNVPDESVAPSNGVPRNVTRASGMAAPVRESLTVPATVTVGPDAGGLATAAMIGACVGSDTRTTVSASSSIRCTRTASFGSRHDATSADVPRVRPRQSVTKPLEPVSPLSDTTRQREPFASLTRHLAPDTGRPSLATTRANSHASVGLGASRSHNEPTYSSADGTARRTNAEEPRRVVIVRPVGICSAIGASWGSSTAMVYGPGNTYSNVARPFGSVVTR